MSAEVQVISDWDWEMLLLVGRDAKKARWARTRSGKNTPPHAVVCRLEYYARL